MDLMDEGLLQFWRTLNKNGVQYIMVGSFAVNMHGFIRATKDANLWLLDKIENRKRLRKAFIELNYGDYSSLETVQFVPGWTNFHIDNGIELDIMTSMKGIEDLTFDECYKLVSIAHLEDVEAPFLHLNHLLANKKAVNRPKDQLDVMELEKIKALQQGTKPKQGG